VLHIYSGRLSIAGLWINTFGLEDDFKVLSSSSDSFFMRGTFAYIDLNPLTELQKVTVRSHKTVEIKVFLHFFYLPDPDPCKYITDQDADPGGPKTYGSYGSGSRSVKLAASL
jgi:hypothetical protein